MYVCLRFLLRSLDVWKSETTGVRTRLYLREKRELFVVPFYRVYLYVPRARWISKVIALSAPVYVDIARNVKPYRTRLGHSLCLRRTSTFDLRTPCAYRYCSAEQSIYFSSSFFQLNGTKQPSSLSHTRKTITMITLMIIHAQHTFMSIVYYLYVYFKLYGFARKWIQNNTYIYDFSRGKAF